MLVLRIPSTYTVTYTVTCVKGGRNSKEVCPADAPSMRLCNGVVMDDPLAEAGRFIDFDVTSHSYDVVPASSDDLTEVDVRVAIRIIARMGSSEITAVSSRREVRAALCIAGGHIS